MRRVLGAFIGAFCGLVAAVLFGAGVGFLQGGGLGATGGAKPYTIEGAIVGAFLVPIMLFPLTLGAMVTGGIIGIVVAGFRKGGR